MLCLCFCLYANIQVCKDGLNATDKIVFVELPENSQQQPAARKPRIAGWALGVRVRVQLWLGPFLVRWATFWYIVIIDILRILLMMLIMHILLGELRCGSRRIGVTWPLSRLLSNLGHLLIFFQMLSSLDVCVATLRLAVFSKMVLWPLSF